MGVYVKKMTMPYGWPKMCDFCIFKDRDWPGYCRVLNSASDWKDTCPVVPVKTPHGRLIDADALVDTVMFHTNIPEDIKEFIGDLIEIAPTVIEAEKDGEDKDDH